MFPRVKDRFIPLPLLAPLYVPESHLRSLLLSTCAFIYSNYVASMICLCLCGLTLIHRCSLFSNSFPKVVMDQVLEGFALLVWESGFIVIVMCIPFPLYKLKGRV